MSIRERIAYVICGGALTWSVLSLIGWWYLSGAREQYDGWRIGQ